MSGERRSAEPVHAAAETAPLAETRFIPQRYEPNYAYPLLVLLHGRGGDEHQLVRALPSMSWRNYVGLGLRGPEVIEREDRTVGYGWGPASARPRPGQARRGHWHSSSEAPGETFRRAMTGEGKVPGDGLEAAVFDAVRGVRRALHVHSERIFLVGVGEGAAAAYRLGLSYPDRFAGVVALNGWLPTAAFRAPVRLDACRALRFLVLHGEWNSKMPVNQARRDVSVLRSAGLRVAFQSYPCGSRLTAPMLSDVDTWLIHQCTAEVGP